MLQRVRVFRSASRNNIAHFIGYHQPDEGYIAYCGWVFDPADERRTDYKTRLCKTCQERKGRRDIT